MLTVFIIIIIIIIITATAVITITRLLSPSICRISLLYFLHLPQIRLGLQRLSLSKKTC